MKLFANAFTSTGAHRAAPPPPRLRTFCRAFAAWLASGERATWIHAHGVNMYVRMDFHCLRSAGLGTDEHPYVPVLAIANVSVDRPGRGTLTALLDWIEPQVRVTYFENVIATSEATRARLCRYLERRGYHRMPGDSDRMPCYYRVRADDDAASRAVGINGRLESNVGVGA